jgi:hypothetical protein
MSDGGRVAAAFLVFMLVVVGLAGLMIWRVLEATLMRLHGG